MTVLLRKRRVLKPGDFPKTWGWQHASQRRQIFVVTQPRRHNIIGDPARQPQPRRLDCLRGKQRVVDAAELHANH